MRRLIDADKLLEILSKNSIFRTVTNAEGKSAIEIIEEQPTAFNADELIEYIKFSIEATNTNDDYSVGLRNGMKLCISCIDGTKPKFEKCKQEYNNWISVEDRLPKDDEYVLIWCKGEFINGTNMGEECEWYGIGYSYGLKWEVFQCKDIEDIEVLAWMPLPKPYKAEKEVIKCD